jgi:hypothetical protein
VSDAERLAAAHEFFWRMADKNNAIPTPEQAKRLIRQLAEALPPFTRIKQEPRP